MHRPRSAIPDVRRLTFAPISAPYGVTSRTVQAELLDSLPHDHPDACDNRRDLRRINAIMGNHRWLARALRAYARPGGSVLELGAGTGELARRLRRNGWRVDGLDRCPAPGAWPVEAQWHRADLRAFIGFDAYDVICGNLIFHQFSASELQAVGRRIQKRAQLILACEPARLLHSQRMFRLFAPLIGANHVSRHDAHVSIAAGFLGEELPRLLGLDPERWAWRCDTAFLGAYHLIAWRRDAKRTPA
jgi:SAM-dependent methyltransferase